MLKKNIKREKILTQSMMDLQKLPISNKKKLNLKKDKTLRINDLKISIIIKIIFQLYHFYNFKFYIQ